MNIEDKSMGHLSTMVVELKSHALMLGGAGGSSLDEYEMAFKGMLPKLFSKLQTCM